MRYLISCQRPSDGQSMSEYVPSREVAAEQVAAVCLMHQMLGGGVELLTESPEDPELHLDLYIGDEKVGHLSAIPVDSTLN